MSEPTHNNNQLNLLSSNSTNATGRGSGPTTTHNNLDILSMAWKLADDMSSPSEREQVVPAAVRTEMVQVPEEIQSSSSPSSSLFCGPTTVLADITGRNNTGVTGIKEEEYMTLSYVTTPADESTELSKYSRLASTHNQSQQRRNLQKVLKKEPGRNKTRLASKKSKSQSQEEPEPVEVHIRLPPRNTNLPVDIKFSTRVKFVVSQEETSIQESTKENLKELVQYEFISDSMTFTPNNGSN